MQKILHSESVKSALSAKGWDQKKLANEIGVSAQAVTNWMKGTDFPRPAALLKIATALSLGFDKLVQQNSETQPVIAFRKKGNAKTTAAHIARAQAMGILLKPLVQYMPSRQSLRTKISNTSLDYAQLQETVAAVRKVIGLGQEAELGYEHLIALFAKNDALIVPVMWGNKNNHENALHILLPAENITFIYLNLDTHLEDFKFWMAHELAHVFTPELAGKDEGEDFADAFAGAILFPLELAHLAYSDAAQKKTEREIIDSLHNFAIQHSISIFSVYKEVKKYAQAKGLVQLNLEDRRLHMARTSNGVRGKLVSSILFEPTPPDACTYISSANVIFQSQFFSALQAMLRERHTGVGYVQQVLNTAISDAQAIYDELTR